MRKAHLKFNMSSYWRVGSGKGAEAQADALILRDEDGLPIIPGRAIKGLLRDAMELASLSDLVKSDRVHCWFGSALAGFSSRGNGSTWDAGVEQERALEAARFQTEEGALWFGSARLPVSWKRWVQTAAEDDKKDVLASLTRMLSSTAIGRDGIVKQHSLRVAEVAVPMELVAEVRGPVENTGWIDDLKHCLPLIRALGSRRNRGFGRVDVKMEVGR